MLSNKSTGNRKLFLCHGVQKSTNFLNYLQLMGALQLKIARYKL